MGQHLLHSSERRPSVGDDDAVLNGDDRKHNDDVSDEEKAPTMPTPATSTRRKDRSDAEQLRQMRYRLDQLQKERALAIQGLQNETDFEQQTDPVADESAKMASDILSFLDDIVSHIEFRSLSPKIAGVSLDKALVRMTLSSLVAFVT